MQVGSGEREGAGICVDGLWAVGVDGPGAALGRRRNNRLAEEVSRGRQRYTVGRSRGARRVLRAEV